jgi:ABC-type phosphate transport system ATPase subunit
VVIVTHNRAQARRAAGSAIVLYQGHMAEHRDAEQVPDHPAHEETAR